MTWAPLKTVTEIGEVPPSAKTGEAELEARALTGGGTPGAWKATGGGPPPALEKVGLLMQYLFMRNALLLYSSAEDSARFQTMNSAKPAVANCDLRDHGRREAG